MGLEQMEIEGGVEIGGELEVSGAKNSALALMNVAVLADGPVRLKRVPILADIETMAELIRSLGAECEREGHDLIIDGTKINTDEAPYETVRKMRASIYVLGALLAKLGHAKVSLPGGCAIGPRPVDLHIRGLEKLGVKIELDHGYIIADGTNMKEGTFRVDGPKGSSVGATANVIMAALFVNGTITLQGAAKEPEIVDMVNLIRAMGGKVTGEGTDTITIEGGNTLHGCEYNVIADRIEAGSFLAAAAITGGEVTLKNVQPGLMTSTLEVFEEIGFPIKTDAEKETIFIGKPQGDLKPVSITTEPFPGFPTDMQAQLTALLTMVEGESYVKETIYVDRFIHVAELMRMGAKLLPESGAVKIHGGGTLSGAPVMASDLRASAALVIAGLRATGKTKILRVYHIDRGYEKIDLKLQKLGAKIRRISQ